MKQSRYNHYIENGDWSYWYNPLYNQFSRLPIELGRKLNSFLDQHVDLGNVSPVFYQKLVDSNFLIEEDVDEIELVRSYYQKAIEKKNAFLIIMPTLNCNYKCWYCIQDHIVSMMSNDTMEAILRHVDYMINVEKIERFHIDWFGGEPFRFYNQVIKPLSKSIIAKCNEAGIPFKNSSTTNAYFLTDKVSKDLEELKFSFFQITLDGDKLNHGQVKFMEGLDSAFDRALINIERILEDNKDVTILLRINYTHKNLSSSIVEEVCCRIPLKYRDRVTIMPKKVWQEGVDKSFESVLCNIMQEFTDKGFRVSLWSPIQSFMPCYVSSKYYKAINFNGNVLKCTACNDLYCSEPRGVICHDGSIRWLDDFDKKTSEASFETEDCLECKRLPACMGICPRDHIQKMKYCKYNNEDGHFETSVIAYIEEQYRRMRD